MGSSFTWKKLSPEQEPSDMEVWAAEYAGIRVSVYSLSIWPDKWLCQCGAIRPDSFPLEARNGEAARQEALEALREQGRKLIGIAKAGGVE